MPTIDLIAQVPVPVGLRPRLRHSLGKLMSELGYGERVVTVVLTNDKEIQELKFKHWGENAPTDVLAFPTHEPGDPFELPHLGDIVISLETAAHQAKEHRHSLQSEVLILCAHALWHLLGHDHPTPQEWEGFHRVQTRILTL